MSRELVSAVKEELKSEGDKRARQLQLISAIASDVSEPTTQLISKLNCKAKRKPPCTSETLLPPFVSVTGKYMMGLAHAILSLRNKGLYMQA